MLLPHSIVRKLNVLCLLGKPAQLLHIAIRERSCREFPAIKNSEPMAQSVPLGVRKAGLVFALQRLLHPFSEFMKIRPFISLLMRERVHYLER